ncbi:hypothetical protein AK812_SmicGene21166 [Symbiodinium microadriaticum]|uniref:Uncharacterized protein n=1 Tax=Symbiodinium microadriaticum TaxID=2951 RepID=A0A1Q9DN40_SYMMI|nr:hypothetical protein AK812_SmicGene21166 [Symbiodinium microadriaticum]
MSRRVYRQMLYETDGLNNYLATALLKLIERDEQRYFPPYTHYISDTGSARIELFDGFMPVLRDMFLQDSEAEHHQRVVVPGVGDPQLDEFPLQAHSRVKELQWRVCVGLGPSGENDKPLMFKPAASLDAGKVRVTVCRL